MDRFVGYDYANNPLTEQYYFHGDSRYTARSEEAADISNWNMMLYQNQYNTPSEQLKRIEEAGLNPLFYLGGNAGTIPAASGGQAQGHQMTSKNGSIENLLQAVNTANAAASTGVEFRKMMNQYDVQKEANAINAYNAETQRMLTNSQVPLNQSIQDYYDYYLGPKTEAEKNKCIEETNNLVKTGHLIESQKANVDQSTKELAALESYYNQMVKTAGSQEQLNYAMRQFYSSYSAYYSIIGPAMEKELVARAGMQNEEARKFAHEATNALWNGNILQFQARMLNKYGEAKFLGEVVDIWTGAAYKGVSAIDTAVGTVFNVASGGLYKGFNGSVANPNFNWNPQAKSLETIPKRNPIGFGN